MVSWVYDDGGRAAAGFKGAAGDCVVRSIAIASGAGYREVYHEMWTRIRASAARHRAARDSRPRTERTDRISPRSGIPRRIYEPYLTELGWVWTPTMRIGSGTTVHLDPVELPDPPRGTGLIVRVSRHITVIRDGAIRDTHDPSRKGTRAVYGYYRLGGRGL